MAIKNKIFTHFSEDGNRCSIGIQSGEYSAVASLNPIEVEALIINLCQSPWRLIAPPSEGVTVH